MSLGEADAKFPGQGNTDQGPSPTRENPAGVFPKSSPTPAPAQGVPGTDNAPENPANILSNPFAWDDALTRLEDALREAITAIDNETSSASNVDGVHSTLLTKFKGWRDELETIRRGEMGGFQYSGNQAPSSRSKVDEHQKEGGMFTD